MFDETKVLAALAAEDVLYAETFEEETASTHDPARIGEDRETGKRRGQRRGVEGDKALADLLCLHQLPGRGPFGRPRERACPAPRRRRAGRGAGRGVSSWRATRFSSWSRRATWTVQKKLDLVRSVETAARKMEDRIRQVKVVYRDAQPAC